MGCFHFLAIINNAACIFMYKIGMKYLLNLCMCVCLCVEEGLLDRMVTLDDFVNCQTVFHSG